ncbi:MAG: phosphoribosyltransferase family protein [Ilumatobacteraceae bacterium]
MGPRFRDRTDAGKRLGEHVARLRDAGRLGDLTDPVVIGLPRGGVPVAAEVARMLDAPLDVIIVRKLGVPHRPELAMGAIGEDDVRVIDDEIVERVGVTASEVDHVEASERFELARRSERFRRDHERVPLAGRDVIIVDDGIATGATARAACLVARTEGARRIVLAVPVTPRGWGDDGRSGADLVVALWTPGDLSSVGQWYDDFAQTSDDEVVALLDHAGR